MTFRMTKTCALTAGATALAVGTLTACGSGNHTSGAEAAMQMPGQTSSAGTTPASPSASSSSTAPKSSTSAAPSRKTTQAGSRDQGRPAATTRTKTEQRTVGFETVRRYDADRAKGSTSVQRSGHTGLSKVTLKQRVVDGKVVASNVVSTDVTRKPVDKVIVIGTKKANTAKKKSTATTQRSAAKSTTSKGSTNSSRSGMWDRIAQCESTGNWHTNTGNGYYGGLQFDTQTWLSAGGGKYAARADLASRAEQITIANKVYSSRGLSPWSCAGAA